MLRIKLKTDWVGGGAAISAAVFGLCFEDKYTFSPKFGLPPPPVISHPETSEIKKSSSGVGDDHQ